MGDGALSWGQARRLESMKVDRDWLPDNWAPRELTDGERSAGMMQAKSDYARALECCMQYGKFKGRSLQDLSMQPAGRNYLRWLWAQKKAKWPAVPNYSERMLKCFMEQSGIGEGPPGRTETGTGRTGEGAKLQ